MLNTASLHGARPAFKSVRLDSQSWKNIRRVDESSEARGRGEWNWSRGKANVNV